MINIYGVLNVLGYGIHTQNMMKAMFETSVDYNLTIIGQPQVDPYFEIPIKEGVNKRIDFNVKNPSVFIYHDHESNCCCGSPTAVFSIFETTKPKDSSIAMLSNGPADIVLVTTQAHKDMLAKYVSKPIEVVHEGIDECIYNSIMVDPLIKTDKFTYITVGKRERRKNTDLIVKSFIDTMKDKDVAFIIHTCNPHMAMNTKGIDLSCWSGINPIEEGFKYEGSEIKAHKFSNGHCDLYFTNYGVPIANMASLYRSAHVAIAVSSGEGWDLPVTELMACGIPVIVSDVLGHSEYIKEAPGIQDLIVKPIGFEKAEDDMYFKGDNGDWSIIKGSDVREKITQTYEQRNKYMKPCEELATYMENNFTWKHAVKQLTKVLSLGV